MKTPLIIDTDPGIDDAIALALALQDSKVDLKLLTSVSGNVGIEHTTANLLKLEQLFHTTVPVARGASEPLVRSRINASDVHGESGMDGYDFPEGDPSLLMKQPAVEAMAQVLEESEEKVTLLALGPETNIALLLKVYPELKAKIKELIVMGGAYTRGNYDVMTEFNVGADPEAAQIVFHSGLPVTMIGLEIGREAAVRQEEVSEVAGRSAGMQMMASLLQVYRGDETNGQWEMYDPTAYAYFCHPEWFDTTWCNVEVETNPQSYTYGQTIVDLNRQTSRQPNVLVATAIDAAAFKQWLLGSLVNGK